MYTSLIAYYLQDWNWIQLAGSIPCLIVGLLYIPLVIYTPIYLYPTENEIMLNKLHACICKISSKFVLSSLPNGVAY